MINSLRDLPKEIVCLIALYLTIPEIDQNFRMLNKYFNSCLSLESFYFQLLEIYDYDVKEKPKKVKTLREWFYISHSSPSTLFVSSSGYDKAKWIKEKYKKFFPHCNVEESCQFRKIAVREKEDASFEVMRKFDVIVTFGGNPIYKNSEWSGDMCRILEETNSAVVSLGYTNCGSSSYAYEGRWKHEGFNPAQTNGKRVFGDMHIMKVINDRWKAMDKPFQRSFSIEGPLQKLKANLIAIWSNKDIEKTVAICERIDMKLIHCNFEMVEQSVDIIFECIKYIHRRKREVEKIWYMGKY